MSLAKSLTVRTAENVSSRSFGGTSQFRVRASRNRAVRAARLECVNAVKFASASKAGKRGEDACFTVQEQDRTFLAVYDGRNGPDAAQYLKENFYNTLVKEMDAAPPANAFVSAYLSTDKAMCTATPPGLFGMFQARGVGGPRCASTAVTALVTGDKLVVANVGDCKALAIKGGEATQLTADHTGESEEERERLQAAIIATLKEKEDVAARIAQRDPSKVFLYGDDVSRGTGFTWQLVQAGTSFPIGGAVTRSLGDAFLSASDQLPQGYGMIADPAVTTIPAGDASWLVLASAPVWKSLTNEEVAKACTSGGDADAAAAAVLAAASAKADADADLTVVVAQLDA